MECGNFKGTRITDAESPSAEPALGMEAGGGALAAKNFPLPLWE